MKNQTTAPPDPATLAHVVPIDAVLADDLRATLLTFWVHRARLAGHIAAEHLRSGNPELDSPEATHCGTARIFQEAFDVYLTGSRVYAVRVDGPNTLILLGLDQPPVAEQPDAPGTNWVTRTAAELTELVERANNLLRTDAGNDVERDTLRDQADMVEIIAALLPAWADRGVHPATETNVELVAARLTHLVDELDG